MHGALPSGRLAREQQRALESERFQRQLEAICVGEVPCVGPRAHLDPFAIVFRTRRAGRLKPDKVGVAIGHTNGRKLVSPLQGDNNVGPHGFDLVVLEHSPRVVNQPCGVDDDERGAGLVREVRRPDHEGQEAAHRIRASDKEMGEGRRRRKIDRAAETSERNCCRRPEIGLPDIGVDNVHLGSLPQGFGQITTKTALADASAANEKDGASNASEYLRSGGFPFGRNVESAA
nr:hypothetical protein [Methylocystis hirsuta]